MPSAPTNASITPAQRPIVEALDRFAARPEIQAVLRAAQVDALAQLQREPGLAAAFVPIDPAALGAGLPAAVGSLRVFATRGAGDGSEERHPNSAQYLLALDAPVETHVLTEAHGWRIDRYGGTAGGALDERWHVVPQGAWHRSVAPGAPHWSVVAFHSAPDVADEYRAHC